MRKRRAFQRLGYRSDADYAREQLGITARTFRDLARLGARLDRLPRAKAAFLAGELTRTQADVVAAVATPADEAGWIERARSETVRGLKAAAREARQAAHDKGSDVAGERDGSVDLAEERHEAAGVPADGEGSADVREDRDGPAGLSEHDGRSGDRKPPGLRTESGMHVDPSSDEDERRQRRSFDVPAAMLGKIDAVLEVAARVAGAPMPAGTLWEFVAAEYLSGAPLAALTSDRGTAAGGRDGGARRPDQLTGEPTLTTLQLRRAATPEDPRGYQRALEHQSRNWYFLPTARPRLELHGEWKRLRPAREECDEQGEVKDAGRARRTPWELHRELKGALAAERRVAWQLGRLLTVIRNRRLWRTMCFASFSHYVRERLGISPRAADRLVRIDREMWRYPPLQRAYHAGELSPLVADTLVRVLRHIEQDDEIRQAWVDFAATVTFEHLTAVVRATERLRDMQPIGYRRRLGPPAQVEAAIASDTAGSPMFGTGAITAAAGSPMFGAGADAAAADSPTFVSDAAVAGVDSRTAVSGATAASNDSPTFVASRYAVWMTEDEHATLAMAMEAVRAVLGAEAGRSAIESDGEATPGAGRSSSGTSPAIPDATCLDTLLDHFLDVYDDADAREMRRRYVVFERDGWRCRAPGCSAYGPLHAHHIVFRAHGGSDDPENLATLCTFHHKALHDRWIRCVGRAPDALYWELGTETGAGPREAPVARVAGCRRLRDDEYWDGYRVLSTANDRGRVA
jgi:hypothetical protein